MQILLFLIIISVCHYGMGIFLDYRFNVDLYLNELDKYGYSVNRSWLKSTINNSGNTNNPNLQNNYDFIIIGSGPAGCVLANRLTKNKKWKVLLVEAGKPENVFHDIPSIAAYFQSTASNWDYTAEKDDRFCWGMENQRCAFPRGKSLGGTSSINYMIYNRGNAHDFDRWAEAGNTGWSYKEVLPYFLRSEHANLRNKENSSYHNRNGELSVEDVPYRSKLVHAFVKGSQEIGHQETDYNNGYEQVGVSYVQANTFNGRRHSASKAFIEPILNKRKNLHVLTESRVTNILIDPTSKKAYGIEMIKNHKIYRVNATKEIILSAGAFNSPQLLMLSGIGPADELARIGVPLIMDLPVGKLLYDHISHFGPTFLVNTTGQTLSVNRLGLKEIKQYIYQGKGFLTSIGGVEALNFIKTKNSQEPNDFPDIELIFTSGSMASDEGTGVRRGMKIKKSIYNTVYKPLERNIDHFTTFVMLFHPQSKGYMTLKDNNPSHWPKFYPNYFDHPDDMETMLEGIKEAIRISKSPAMQKLGTRLHDIPLPECKQYHFGSDDYWRCSIRTLSCTLHHQVGTCKMGPKNDKTAVVDPQLRVYGIKRLRIADCSIVPIPPTSHTNAISFMIGEKLSDMLKSDWKDQ